MPQKPQTKITRAAMSKPTVKRLFSDSDSEDEIIEVAADGTMTPKKQKKMDGAKFLFREDYHGNDKVLKWTLKEYAREQAKYPHLTEFVELVTTRKMLATMLKGYMPAMDDSFPDTLRNYKFDGSFFDTSVYDKNWKMEPIVEETKYLIQNVSKDAQEVQWEIEKPTSKAKKIVNPIIKEESNADIIDDNLATVHRSLMQVPKFEDAYAQQDEHDTSVSKMYFVLTRDAIKFKCAHCDSESKVQHEDQQLVDIIQRNSVDEWDQTKPLSLATAAQIFNNRKNEEGLIEYLNMFFAKVTGMEFVWFASRETPSSPWLLRKESQFLDAISHLSFKYYLKQEEGPDIEKWYKFVTG
ncbi:hypothetical protein HK104_006774 [Borealophlyctis nickersoniae]|nr:hypothetical protein HK104_006774 [Borealophlyctis nickersoniae]